MRETMSDDNYYNLNQASGDAKKSHNLAERYFQEGLELAATVKQQKQEIEALSKKLAKALDLVLGV